MDPTRATEGDAYRGSYLVALAGLPRPRRPRHITGMGPSDIDLGATALLPARFELAGARVEETWSSGAFASRDGVVLAASVIGIADNLVLGTAYPRTRGILRASIPRSVGSVVVVPRRRAGVMGWAARRGLVGEHTLAEPAAREALFVRGDEASSRVLLTPDVCVAILALGSAFWRLAIGDGVVDLSWRAPRFDPEIVLPTEAVDMVVALARAAALSAS